MERVEQAIREIINGIKTGLSFDSHTILYELAHNYKLIYDEFLEGKETNIAHANIARHILANKLEKEGIIERITWRNNEPLIHYSININNKESENALWYKVI